jgi:hypothetical protein
MPNPSPIDMSPEQLSGLVNVLVDCLDARYLQPSKKELDAPFVTLEKFAEMTGMKKQAVVDYANDGVLPVFKLNNKKYAKRFVDVGAVEAQVMAFRMEVDKSRK